MHDFNEHPQSMLLTDAVTPRLNARHPDGMYAIGQDCGIYWHWDEREPLRGAVAPDWFYVPGVPPLLDGEVRRSYVLWREPIRPLVAMEFVSKSKGGERDRTPMTGKFWIYEQMIRPRYYVIYDVKSGIVEAYDLAGEFRPIPPNEHGHVPLEQLGLALGIWQATYHNQTLPWLRWFDLDGTMLPTGAERAEQERQRAEVERWRAEEAEQAANDERQRAEEERQRADEARQRADRAEQRNGKYIAKLRELGIDPDSLNGD